MRTLLHRASCFFPTGRAVRQHPNLLLASGKQGTVYVINRSNMGHFHPHSDNVVEEIPHAVTSSFDTPAYYLNTVYYAGVGDVAQVVLVW